MEKNKNVNTIISAIILIGIVIGGAILLKDSKPINDNSVKTAEETSNLNDIQIKTIDENDHILGKKDAMIKIVEFADLECSYCKKFHTTMHQMVRESEENIAWVYRHFPLSGENSTPFKESLASECAWEQGGDEKFFAFIDLVFERTDHKHTFSDIQLQQIAKDLKLDENIFNDCLSTEKYKEKVNANLADGMSAKVSGTPSGFIMIEGQVVDTIPGALSYEALMTKITKLFE